MSNSLMNVEDPTFSSIICRTYRPATDPNLPMRDGSCPLLDLMPDEVLVRIFDYVPENAFGIMMTCKKLSGPAIEVHWKSAEISHFKNITRMKDDQVKAGYIDKVRHLKIAFEGISCPSWLPVQKTIVGTNVAFRQMITTKLESLTIRGISTDDLSPALGTAHTLHTLRLQINGCNMGDKNLAEVLSRLPSLRVFELGVMREASKRDQSNILAALACLPMLRDLALLFQTADQRINRRLLNKALSASFPFRNLQALTICTTGKALLRLLGHLINLKHLFFSTVQTLIWTLKKISRAIGRLTQLESVHMESIQGDEWEHDLIGDLKDLSRLTKLCIAERLPILADTNVAQVENIDEVMMHFSTMHLEHLEIISHSHQGSAHTHDKALGDRTAIFNKIGRACRKLKVLVLPGCFDVAKMDVASPTLFPHLERLGMGHLIALKLGDYHWSKNMKIACPKLMDYECLECDGRINSWSFENFGPENETLHHDSSEDFWSPDDYFPVWEEFEGESRQMEIDSWFGEGVSWP